MIDFFSNQYMLDLEVGKEAVHVSKLGFLIMK